MTGLPRVTQGQMLRALTRLGFAKRTGKRRGKNHDLYEKYGYPLISVPRHRGNLSLVVIRSIKAALRMTNDEFAGLF